MVAWHAGGPRGANPNRTIRNINSRSIGIDLQAPTDGTVTSAQFASLNRLISDICRRRNIPKDDAHIIGHRQVAKGHHGDPERGFVWTNVNGLTYNHRERDPPSMVPGLWTDDDGPQPTPEATTPPASTSGGGAPEPGNE